MVYESANMPMHIPPAFISFPAWRFSLGVAEARQSSFFVFVFVSFLFFCLLFFFAFLGVHECMSCAWMG